MQRTLEVVGAVGLAAIMLIGLYVSLPFILLTAAIWLGIHYSMKK